ncbi:MAG: RNA-directed DNA polymerase, partial [bacterium]|nr:RNA-directed DNA polymerase [bacterium]
DAERHLPDLSDAITAGRYQHGRYSLLKVWDPKPRPIAVASVGDRVVHRSIYDGLAPCFNRSFIDDSYACLPGRGNHRAVLRFLEMQRLWSHVMHLDVRGYFPSVDHRILLDLLAPRLRDSRIVSLLEAILDSGRELYLRPEVVAFYGMPEGRPRGLPIGNLTSQWWGNLYLDGFDQFVKRELKVRGYSRYMDDLVFFADEPATLRRWRGEVRDWLWEYRRLQLNVRKGHVRSAELPQSYLGYRVTRQGYDLGPKAVRRFRRQLSGLAAGDLRRMRRVLASWRGARGISSTKC